MARRSTEGGFLMAVPIDPESGLFPDSFVAPFVVAPEVEELAQQVIDSCDEFANLEAALRESQVTIVYRVTAKGSTDAADQAKALARRDGYRVQTVASVRPAAGAIPSRTEAAQWVVALAVRR